MNVEFCCTAPGKPGPVTQCNRTDIIEPARTHGAIPGTAHRGHPCPLHARITPCARRVPLARVVKHGREDPPPLRGSARARAGGSLTLPSHAYSRTPPPFTCNVLRQRQKAGADVTDDSPWKLGVWSGARVTPPTYSRVVTYGSQKRRCRRRRRQCERKQPWRSSHPAAVSRPCQVASAASPSHVIAAVRTCGRVRSP